MNAEAFAVVVGIVQGVDLELAAVARARVHLADREAAAEAPRDGLAYGVAGTLATNTPYGTGCGGLTVNGLSRPVTGANWELGLGNVPAGTVLGAILLGLGNPNVSLGAAAPGCTQYSGDIGFVLLLLPIPSPAVSLTIPSDPSYIGVSLSAQGGALVPGANPLGVALSAGLQGTIGDI